MSQPPNIDGVLPKKAAFWGLRVNPELLILVLRAASEVCKSKDEVPVVELLYYGPNLPLGVACQGKDGLTFDALVMPMT